MVNDIFVVSETSALPSLRAPGLTVEEQKSLYSLEVEVVLGHLQSEVKSCPGRWTK